MASPFCTRFSICFLSYRNPKGMQAYFKDIEIGTYTLKEVSPGNAYILPEPQTVTIPGNDIA